MMGGPHPAIPYPVTVRGINLPHLALRYLLEGDALATSWGLYFPTVQAQFYPQGKLGCDKDGPL